MRLKPVYDLDEMNPRSLEVAFKGGKSKPPPPPPLVAPTPPVEEASVEIDDEQKKKKASTGKSRLKLPLADTATTVLNV